MIKKTVSIVIISVVVLTGLHSQNLNDTLCFERFSIGITPSALFNVYNAAQVNFNLGLTKKLKATAETGYVFNSLYSGKAWGYRLKYGIEWILKARNNDAFIIGISGIYRQVEETRFETVNHPERYREKVFFQRMKRMQGFQVSAGQIIKLNKKMRMSYLLGAGVGAINVNDVNSELDFTSRDGFLFFNNPGDYNFPVISFNVKYMYTLAEFR
ncbi:MAG: hypothetical protein ACM3PT_02035 [Deltaproteobacteria bacterium]